MHADVFEALADPTRRRIVETLMAGERPVNDIVAAMDIHQSGVSRHLRLLNEAGFVSVRADGQRRLYSLRAAPFQQLDGWLSRYRRLWEGRLDALGAELERRAQGRGEKPSRGKSGPQRRRKR